VGGLYSRLSGSKLYRIIRLFTYSRTTEQKSKDSYKTLKDIENNIHKTADSIERKEKSTINDFKEIEKTVDDDRNVLYNLYVKYKAWHDVDGPRDSENYTFVFF
jgi:hypothetical protein